MTFTYTASAADWGRIVPELVLVVTALLALLADLLLPRGTTAPRGVTLQRESGQAQGPALDFLVLPILSLVGLAGAFIATLIMFSVGDHQNAFFSMIGSDLGSLYAYIIILSTSILAILLSPAYLKRLNLVHQGEY